MVAIIGANGANGAGKSSMLKTIAGLKPAAAGSVFFIDQGITNMPAHRRPVLGMALSAEGRGVFPDQSVRDNLMLGAYSRRHDKEGIARGIARALMSQPKPLLLDEPSLGLTPLIIEEIFATIRALRAQGLSILLVEQMANPALAIADYAYVLETGRVTHSGAESRSPSRASVPASPCST